jgi:hypothetical protein
VFKEVPAVSTPASGQYRTAHGINARAIYAILNWRSDGARNDPSSSRWISRLIKTIKRGSP